jgi:hypothetical protein
MHEQAHDPIASRRPRISRQPHKERHRTCGRLVPAALMEDGAIQLVHGALAILRRCRDKRPQQTRNIPGRTVGVRQPRPVDLLCTRQHVAAAHTAQCASHGRHHPPRDRTPRTVEVLEPATSRRSQGDLFEQQLYDLLDNPPVTGLDLIIGIWNEIDPNPRIT